MFTVQFIYSVCSAGVKNIKLPVPSQPLCLTTNKCKIGFDHAIIFNFKSIFSSDTKMIRATRYFCISRYLKYKLPNSDYLTGYLPTRLPTMLPTYLVGATMLPTLPYPTLPYPTLPCSTPQKPTNPPHPTHPPTPPTHPTPPHPARPPHPTLP